MTSIRQMRWRRGSSFVVFLGILILLLGGGAAAWYFLSARKAAAGGEQLRDKFFSVRKGSFNLTILVKGTLDPIKRHNIACEGRGRFELVIMAVVEDRLPVKKGDVIARLNGEKYEEELKKRLLALEDTRKDLLLAEQDLNISKSANVSAIKSAADDLRTTREALRKYLDLESPKKRLDLQNEIRAKNAAVLEAERDLKTARNALSTAQSGDKDVLAGLARAKVAADKKRTTALREVKVANQNYRVFKQYDHPQKIRELHADVAKASLKQQVEIVKAGSSTVQGERRIQNHQLRIKDLIEKVKDVREDLGKLVLRAPVDGIITFGNPRRRHWQTPKEIKVGTSIRPREIIATIPDLSTFRANVDIPEEFRSQIRPGLKAKLTSPAMPDLIMVGKVSYIAPMPTLTIRWDKNSPKIYATQLSTDEHDDRMRPGMSVNIEIIVESVTDALYVPVEAVYNREGKTYCKIRGGLQPEERKVKTGRSSVHFVEILDGLKLDEEVLLYRRVGGSG